MAFPLCLQLKEYIALLQFLIVANSTLGSNAEVTSDLLLLLFLISLVSVSSEKDLF